MPASTARTKGVDSARRALEILLQFSERRPEQTIEDIIERHALSVPSAYRYVSLLRELNLIEERNRGTFVLSPQVLTLARAAEATLDYRAQAQPILDRLSDETGETALYLRRVNESAVCLAIAETDHTVSISFQPGHMMPLHGGAGAKILLSEYPRRAQYLDRVGSSLPAGEQQRLAEDLERIRSEGYAESAGEVDQGVWASAAPVRVHGALIGVVTVAAPGYRLSEEHKREIAEAVRSAAHRFEDVIAAAG